LRVVIQRVSEASVSVDGKVVGEIGQGLLLLAGVHRDDTEESIRKAADRVVGLRIFSDVEGKMNLSIKDALETPEILAVSNFTVYGDASKSRRPSFTQSAPYEAGRSGFELFCQELQKLGVRVATGEFGADMSVRLVNDGPVTLVLDTEAPGNASES